jgi:hypothetical protein
MECLNLFFAPEQKGKSDSPFREAPGPYLFWRGEVTLLWCLV